MVFKITPNCFLKSKIYTELPRVNTWLQKRSWAWKENLRFEVYLFIYKAVCLNTEVFGIVHCKGVCGRKFYIIGLYLSVLVWRYHNTSIKDASFLVSCDLDQSTVLCILKVIFWTLFQWISSDHDNSSLLQILTIMLY